MLNEIIDTFSNFDCANDFSFINTVHQIEKSFTPSKFEYVQIDWALIS